MKTEKTTQLRSHRNLKKTQLRICTRFIMGNSLLYVLALYIIFVLMTQIEALTTQLRNMRHKLKQKRSNFEVTKILKRHNFEAVAEQGDANWSVSVFELKILYFPLIIAF